MTMSNQTKFYTVKLFLKDGFLAKSNIELEVFTIEYHGHKKSTLIHNFFYFINIL